MWQTIKPALTYGLTFFGGLVLGAVFMQKALKKALMQSTAGIDPNILNSITQQLQTAAATGSTPLGANLDVLSTTNNAVPLPAPPPYAVKRDVAIQPLNITAAQLAQMKSGGNMIV